MTRMSNIVQNNAVNDDDIRIFGNHWDPIGPTNNQTIH